MLLKAYLPIAALGLALAAPPADAAEAKSARFGTLPDGREITAVTLTNKSGVSASVISYGATLQSVVLPDRNGRKADVVLGHAKIDDYLARPQFFGSTVGRFANRLAKGRFTLNGRTYQAPINNGANTLHGGTIGFDKALWQVVAVRSGAVASVTMRHVSPDGDQGFPGTLTVDATYSLDERNHLTIDYVATTDRTTIVNMTNHAYWNLSGEGAAGGAMGHVLTIPAATYTSVDAALIPTGETKPVAGTPFDFRTPRVVGERVRDARDPQILRGRGYDHNWVLSKAVTPEQHLMARVHDPVSGRGFELWSNQPGLQVYSGNHIDGTLIGKSGRVYRLGDGLALEPQLFPDAPNHAGFPSARLNPGETYRNVMTYRLTTGKVARR